MLDTKQIIAIVIALVVAAGVIILSVHQTEVNNWINNFKDNINRPGAEKDRVSGTGNLQENRNPSADGQVREYSLDEIINGL